MICLLLLLSRIFCVAAANPDDDEEMTQVLSFNAKRNEFAYGNYVTFRSGRGNSFQSNHISACFRILPRYSSGMKILRMLNMLEITLSDFEEKYGYVQAELPRVFNLCGDSSHWFSVCTSVSYQTSTEHMKVYHNGRLCLDKAFAGSFPKQPIQFQDQITIGINDRGFLGKGAYGKMTDVSIWNRTLSDNEMLAFTSNCSEKLNKTGKL